MDDSCEEKDWRWNREGEEGERMSGGTWGYVKGVESKEKGRKL